MVGCVVGWMDWTRGDGHRLRPTAITARPGAARPRIHAFTSAVRSVRCQSPLARGLPVTVARSTSCSPPRAISTAVCSRLGSRYSHPSRSAEKRSPAPPRGGCSAGSHGHGRSGRQGQGRGRRRSASAQPGRSRPPRRTRAGDVGLEPGHPDHELGQEALVLRLRRARHHRHPPRLGVQAGDDLGREVGMGKWGVELGHMAAQASTRRRRFKASSKLGADPSAAPPPRAAVRGARPPTGAPRCEARGGAAPGRPPARWQRWRCSAPSAAPSQTGSE